MNVELVRTFHLDAAHYNPNGSERQRRLHGHTYRVDIVVAGEVAPEHGWLVDYADIKTAFLPFHRQLDHQFLNEVEGMKTGTIPDLREWIVTRLRPVLPILQDVRVAIVGDCAYAPVELPPDLEAHLPARIRFTFETAQDLPNLPERHPCRRLHGHSYRVEAAAADLSALKQELAALYDMLDHRRLNDIEGLGHATCERLCEWIWNWLDGRGRQPAMVVVQETESARCVYHGP